MTETRRRWPQWLWGLFLLLAAVGMVRILYAPERDTRPPSEDWESRYSWLQPHLAGGELALLSPDPMDADEKHRYFLVQYALVPVRVAALDLEAALEEWPRRPILLDRLSSAERRHALTVFRSAGRENGQQVEVRSSPDGLLLIRPGRPLAPGEILSEGWESGTPDAWSLAVPNP